MEKPQTTNQPRCEAIWIGDSKHHEQGDRCNAPATKTVQVGTVTFLYLQMCLYHANQTCTLNKPWTDVRITDLKQKEKPCPKPNTA